LCCDNSKAIINGSAANSMMHLQQGRQQKKVNES
jgi:hypothetical protein